VPVLVRPVTRPSDTSPGVELRFGVSPSGAVSPDWFSDPSTPFRRPRGIPAPALGVVCSTSAHPPLSLLSPPEFDWTGPPPAKPAAALLGFVPLQRFQNWKPGSLGFASPDTFRLQGFAPSCRFPSSRTSRPCFMPETLLGFSFRAFPLAEPSVPFGTGPLRGVGCRLGSVSTNPETQPVAVNVAFKALLSARIRHKMFWVEPTHAAAALLDF